MAASPEISESQATRLLIRAVGAVVAVVFSAGVFAASRARSAGRGSPNSSAITAPSVAPVITAAPIGPPPGMDVPTYVGARAGVLAAADGERRAVVSFTSYITAGDARLRIGSLPVFAFLVARPAQPPEVVTVDPRGEVVFGALVTAPASVLRDVARRRGVRLVDPGGSGGVPGLAAIAGLRPEETRTAGEPPSRPR